MPKAHGNRRRNSFVALMVPLIAMLSGCGTVPYLIKDEETLKSVKLAENEGFLVARVYTDFSEIKTPNKIMEQLNLPENIILDFKARGSGMFYSPQELRKFSTWDPLLVIKVPAATYQWDALDFRAFTHDVSSDREAFEIKADSFNYIGDLYIDITEDADGNFFATVTSEDAYSEIGHDLEVLFGGSADDFPLVRSFSDIRVTKAPLYFVDYAY